MRGAATVRFARFSAAERMQVDRIVPRAVGVLRAAGAKVDEKHVRMDLAAVHAHTPLRLAELADADDFNFTHDIGGIYGCLDRTTGELRNHFHPRFAVRTSAGGS